MTANGKYGVWSAWVTQGTRAPRHIAAQGDGMDVARTITAGQLTRRTTSLHLTIVKRILRKYDTHDHDGTTSTCASTLMFHMLGNER